MNLYSQQNHRTSWNGVISTNFSVPNGVRQGGVLSPILFNVYIDELLLRLKQHDFGCHIGKRFVGGLCYADDLTILSASVRGLQKMVGIWEEFANDYSVTFNSDKTLCISLGRMPQTQIYLNGLILQWLKNGIVWQKAIRRIFNLPYNTFRCRIITYTSQSCNQI